MPIGAIRHDWFFDFIVASYECVRRQMQNQTKTQRDIRFDEIEIEKRKIKWRRKKTNFNRFSIIHTLHPHNILLTNWFLKQHTRTHTQTHIPSTYSYRRCKMEKKLVQINHRISRLKSREDSWVFVGNGYTCHTHRVRDWHRFELCPKHNKFCCVLL